MICWSKYAPICTSNFVLANSRYEMSASDSISPWSYGVWNPSITLWKWFQWSADHYGNSPEPWTPICDILDKDFDDEKLCTATEKLSAILLYSISYTYHRLIHAGRSRLRCCGDVARADVVDFRLRRRSGIWTKCILPKKSWKHFKEWTI
jgi:hypothetical protein